MTLPPLEVVSYATSLRLPWPPSTNSYWQPFAIEYGAQCRCCRRRIGRGRVVMTLTPRAKLFRSDVVVAIRQQLGGRPLEPFRVQVRVDIELRPPDCRDRDIDNHDGKSLFDALTHAGVWTDDKLVRERSSRFGQNISGGCVNVLIAPLERTYIPAPSAPRMTLKPCFQSNPV